MLGDWPGLRNAPLEGSADMKADGDRLVIDLKTPNADFPMYLGYEWGYLMP